VTKCDTYVTPTIRIEYRIVHLLVLPKFLLNFLNRFSNLSSAVPSFSILQRARIAQLVQRLATGWTVRGSNPGGGEIFRTRPDRPCGPPSLLYNEYRVSFLGAKRPGRGVDHPPSSSARVKERVELYLYSPSGPSWLVLGGNLPLPYILQNHLALKGVVHMFTTKFISENKTTLWTRITAS
jgi:hypothetical protein